MKKKYLFIFITVVLTITAGVMMTKFVSKDRDKTANYGAVSAPISPKYLKKQQCRQINREGLDRLNAHGSGTINFNDFMPGYKGDMSKVYVVNLRHENLYYYNNRCLRWYGLGCTDSALGMPLHRGIQYRINHYFIMLIYGSPPVNGRSKLQTEEEIIHNLGAHYYMPLKNNRNWLTGLSYLDDVINFFQNLPDDAVLYIHCLHGKARTTTFLVLYDIFKNHKKVPLIDIVNRHYCLGRENLFNTVLWEKGWWTQEGLDARKNLVVQFYAYMTDPDGYPSQKWSTWIKKRGIDATPIQIHR